MANTFTFNTDWFGHIAGNFLYCHWGNATSGGTVFSQPYRYKSDGTGNYTHFFDNSPTVDDAFYIGFTGGRATGIDWYTSSSFTPISSDSHSVVWEYWNGSSWQSLPNLVDGTSGFTQKGQVTWDLPSDWTAYNYTDSNGRNYPAFWIRVRLTAFTNFTNGGKFYYAYVKIRPYTIHITGTDDLYIEDIYDADQTNGWGTVEKPNWQTLIFKYGFVNDCSGRFIVKNWTTKHDYWQPKLQFGTETEPCFWGAPFRAKDFRINDPLIYSFPTSAMPKRLKVLFYTSWMLRAYASIDYISISSSGSNGVSYRAYASNTDFEIRGWLQNDNGVYDPCSCVNRIIPSGWVKFYLCNFETDISTGSTVTQGYSAYERCNLSQIQYVLTRNYNAEYKNCYIGKSFNIDPRQEVILKNTTIDTGTSENSYWYSRYTPYTYDNSHYLEVRDCEWPVGNKYVKSYSFNNYPSENLYLKTFWTCSVNINVKDEQGNPIEGIKIYFTDGLGQINLYKRLENTWMTDHAVLTTDTTNPTIPLNDVSEISVGDYLKIMGEIVKVTGWTSASYGYDVSVEREQLGTTLAHMPYPDTGSSSQYYSVGVYKLHQYIETDSNGNTGEYILVERMQDRAGDSTTYREVDYNPFTVEFRKSGYRLGKWKGDINSKIDWKITLTKNKVLNLSNSVKIYE